MALTNIEQRIKGGEKSICNTCAHNKVCRYMDNQPCIECSQYAEQERHGRWKSVGLASLKCSVCGYVDDHKMYYKGCPECRAKMYKE